MNCKKCDSGDIKTEVMWRVTGQQGLAPESITVNKCQGCGTQWTTS